MQRLWTRYLPLLPWKPYVVLLVTRFCAGGGTGAAGESGVVWRGGALAPVIPSVGVSHVWAVGTRIAMRVPGFTDLLCLVCVFLSPAGKSLALEAVSAEPRALGTPSLQVEVMMLGTVWPWPPSSRLRGHAPSHTLAAEPRPGRELKCGTASRRLRVTPLHSSLWSVFAGCLSPGC